MIRYAAMDPRAKLAFALTVAGLAVVIPQLPALAVLGVTVLLVVGLGTGGFRWRWLRSLAPFQLLIPIIFVLNTFFYGGGEVLWSATLGWLRLQLTTGGLTASTVIAGRLLVLAGIASWFALTTDAEEFEAALVKLGVPWSFAFVISLTVRVFPELRDRFQTIDEAQRSRGLVLEGGPLARVRKRIPMFIPFFVSVVTYGYELGEALVIRDYGRHTTRTSVVSLEHGTMDYGWYLASVALLVGFASVFLL